MINTFLFGMLSVIVGAALGVIATYIYIKKTAVNVSCKIKNTIEMLDFIDTLVLNEISHISLSNTDSKAPNSMVNNVKEISLNIYNNLTIDEKQCIKEMGVSYKYLLKQIEKRTLALLIKYYKDEI